MSNIQENGKFVCALPKLLLCVSMCSSSCSNSSNPDEHATTSYAEQTLCEAWNSVWTLLKKEILMSLSGNQTNILWSPGLKPIHYTVYALTIYFFFKLQPACITQQVCWTFYNVYTHTSTPPPQTHTHTRVRARAHTENSQAHTKMTEISQLQ